ncbi:hypothetical protein DD238_000153 [Peronospora effusa]|uniref:Topoisomerase 6 subunit A/Spo11 TOPRIM domain-containing protein n=1 Tax=Peronospora effusa TaxID=542832 RepID=A0A3M6VUA6_9STRA|nr:hypothetical protein DD238_000153 [Peronospora effusa]RQM14911.1 hypothetical protein DD237_003933 [Peronospora effusa]
MATGRKQEEATATGWSREEVLHHIELLAAEFLKCLSLKRSSSAMIYDRKKQQQFHGNETRLIRLNRQGGRRYTGIWLILQTVHALLTENKTATQVCTCYRGQYHVSIATPDFCWAVATLQRDVYYLHPFFKGQSEADEAILDKVLNILLADTGSILGVPRGCMNIVGATKGFFTGNISILRDGQWRHFSSGEEVSITQELLQLKPSEMYAIPINELIPLIWSRQSNAKCIVVIEKDDDSKYLNHRSWISRSSHKVFHHLEASYRFDVSPHSKYICARMFVSLLSRVFELPVFGLCDCNPFGLSIMLTYKLGSARMPLESLQYAVDIKWVGFRPSQAARLGLPSSSLKALTRKDIAVADSLLRTSFVQANGAYKEEVEMWLGDSLPWKIELEALHFLGFTFLTSFLQDCIKKGNFL